MKSLIYLNPAGLGRFEKENIKLVNKFLLFQLEVGPLSQTATSFILHGFNSLPNILKKKYPELKIWQGQNQMNKFITKILKVTGDSYLHLGYNTSDLYSILLSYSTRLELPIVYFDFEHPTLKKFMTKPSIVNKCRIRELDSTNLPWSNGAELIDSMVNRVSLEGNCLFIISAVPYAIPVKFQLARIMDALRGKLEKVKIAVDGSHMLGQFPVDFSKDYPDVFLGCTHKWLSSALPLGFLIAIAKTNSSLISSIADAESLLSFTSDENVYNRKTLKSVKPNECGTVSCAQLIAGFHALQKLNEKRFYDNLRKYHITAKLLSEKITSSIPSWKIIPTGKIETGGLMFVIEGPAYFSRFSSKWVERYFEEEFGIILKAISGNKIRISVQTSLSTKTVEYIVSAFMNYQNIRHS